MVDRSCVRGWSFPPGLSQCYEPILYHHRCKSTADKAPIVHFFSYFSYDMSYCFLYSNRWGGHFHAADSHHITGVIPSNFRYDNWFQSKFISMHEVSGLYIYTKFYHVPTTRGVQLDCYSCSRLAIDYVLW